VPDSDRGGATVNDTGDMRDWTEPDDDLVPPPEPPPSRRRRRFRPVLWALEVAGAAVGALLLGLVLIAIRLEFGPIEVDYLTPMLVDYLNVVADPLSVRIERTSLNWSEGRSTVDVIGSGLQVADAAGREIISLPKLSLSVSLRALTSGRFALSRVSVIGPHVQLVRARSGEVGIDLGAATPGRPGLGTDPALAETPPTVQEMWADFAGRSSADRSLSYLDRISIAQADVTLDDRQSGLLWHVGAGEINFRRRDDGLDAELSGSVGLGQDETRLTGTLRYAMAGQRLGFSLGWNGFDPSRVSSALPAPYAAAAARLQLPIAGKAEGEIGLGDDIVGPLHLQLEAGAGVVADPFFAGGRLALAGLKFDAQYAPEEHRLTLGRLLLDLGGPSVDLSGAVDHFPADPLALLSGKVPPMTASAAILVHAMPVDRLGAYWPPALAANPRKWIAANMAGGSIDELRTNAALTLDPAGNNPVQATDFGGTMSIKGTSVDYLSGLPHVEGIDATLTMQPKQLAFDITAGHLKGLAISKGSVVIDQFDAPFERATIDIALSGPAQDVMTVLDAKRLQYARALGIDPHLVGGTVDGTLHFRLPLRKSLPIADVEYGAKAQLDRLAVGHVVLGRDLSDGNLALTLDPRAVTLEGTAKLDGLAGSVSFQQRLSGEAGPRLEAHVKTTVDDTARKRFGLDLLPDNLHGPVATDLTYDELDAHRAQANVALDLGAATLTVDELGWHKPSGPAAHGGFTVDFTDGHPTRLSNLTLHGPHMEITGELGFADDGRLTEARMPKFRLGETDASLTLAHDDGVWRLGLRGPVIDVGELLKQLKDKPEMPHPDAGPTIDLDVQAEQVVLGPNRVLRNAQMKATLADHSLARGRLAADFAANSKIDFRLDALDAGGAFSLNTDDFGGLLSVAEVSDDVVGGKLAINGHATREAKGRRFTGRAEGGDYRFTGAPFMVRLLSIASLSSIQTLVNGDGIPFSTLKADLSLYDGKLGLSHARAYGGALAVNVAEGSFDLDAGQVDLDGTLVPAYTLNSALGNVPIIGDLLLGGEGQGLFAANFRMSGQIDNPAIAVNPFSPLAPGFLRRMFLFDAPEPAREDKDK
jgi:hypothetical protein